MQPNLTTGNSDMKTTFQLILTPCWIIAGGLLLGGCATSELKGYRGKPYQDSMYHGGPQRIPGRVQCAYYDLGGEGVAYHNADKRNQGSGALNPADGTYLHEFRMKEGISTSYT